MERESHEWLREAIFYQIYPQSFKDANRDGIGDIEGIIEKLDYVQSLGVNAIWLNPCFVSPFQDAGYDVSDYCKVAPRYGTNADLRRLFRESHRRGLKVCLDLVPGHTSVDHPWFRLSSMHRTNEYTDRYIWSESVWQNTDDTIPFVKGYAERNGSYAVNFFYCQPALNYGYAKPDPEKSWQHGVNAAGPVGTRKALKDIMAYWLEQGADGFRVDMAASLVKNDPGNRENIKLWRGIRRWLQEHYPRAVLISEWGNPKEAISAGFDIDFMMHFGAAGYPELLLNHDCYFRRQGGRGISDFLGSYLAQHKGTKGRGYISIPTANHDFKRPRSDGRSLSDLKVIFTMLLTWPGVPFVYYGDEIGMRFIEGLPSKEGGYNRTGTRTPMQWTNARNAGFSSASASDLYLPVDSGKTRPSVESQELSPRSLLNHVRHLTQLRKSSRALQADGKLTPLFAKSDQSPFVYLRHLGKESFLIALNPKSEPAEVMLPGMAAEGSMQELGRGVRLTEGKRGTKVRLSGSSYAVFRL